ncbi:hypothetical protein DL764_009515 [Monosporascus ibericus]|uniref:Rhodopsin domain-containing protein n=1 Tax=Monosporascus ibericus TaxID=155417 RepID=A0A4Q4SXP5_9PEZI|nr:hypothetical protein DL764_009515 [Monosporascus ibericus]
METVGQAQVANNVCAALSMSILTARIVICRWYGKPTDLSFYLVILSMLAIAGRTATNHVYLSLGSANDALRGPDAAVNFDEVKLADIRIAAIMILLSRVLSTVALWLQNAILLLFYSNITSGIRLIARMIKVSWTWWIISLASIILAILLECRPMRLYWQLKPDPGQCVKAYIQLLLQGISNIVLDLMLLFIAYPLVTLGKRSWAERVSLYTLFALGAFSMITTIIRLVLIFEQDSSMANRGVWASVNIAVITFVANTPTLYGTLRGARRKSFHRPVTSTQTSGDTQRRPSRLKQVSWLRMDVGEIIPLGSIAPKPPQPLRQAALACDGEPNITAYNPTPPFSYGNSQYAHGKQTNWASHVR